MQQARPDAAAGTQNYRAGVGPLPFVASTPRLVEPSSPVECLRSLAERVLALRDQLPAEDWNRPSACPGWSVHDVVVHLSCTLRELAAPDELPLPVAGSVERSNDAAVLRFRDVAPAETLRRYQTLLEPALEALRQLADEPAASEPVDFDDAGTYPQRLLVDSLVFDHYCHLRFDLGGRGPLRISTEVEPAVISSSLRWMMAGLPQMSPPRLGTELSVPVELLLTGPGGSLFSLRRNGGAVCVSPGGDVDAKVRLVCSTDRFHQWATHRISWREAELAIEGDRTLGERVADAVRVF